MHAARDRVVDLACGPRGWPATTFSFSASSGEHVREDPGTLGSQPRASWLEVDRSGHLDLRNKAGAFTTL